jgi:WhiB family redox-sensing transcriptional regulator
MAARHNSPEYNDLEWKMAAACRGLDPNMFFPTAESDAEMAIRVCAKCVVKSECLEYALVTNEQYGIWGGTTEDERRKLRKGWLQGRVS